jgi:myo-inositol-1(or 4)-monophosphatase
VRGVAFDLAHALREIVLPRLGAADGRAHARESVGGDVTFAIDAEAEEFLAGWVAANAPQMAFYSEDRGMVAPGSGDPEFVLIVDPIDGTRPALAGLEAACTSVALAPLGEGEPTMGDVVAGCVVEIKSGDWFDAVRGEGCRASRPIALSSNLDLERLFWVYGFTRRPARPVVEVIGELIDRSSLGGGVFDLGSATFNITRILTGQLDAYVEPGARMVAEIPGMREEFARVGGGSVVNNSPYDLAAAALCLTEGGAVITDAAGGSIGPYRLLGSDPDFHISCVAAASSALHAMLIDAVARGMERLRTSDIVAPPQSEQEGP